MSKMSLLENITTRTKTITIKEELSIYQRLAEIPHVSELQNIIEETITSEQKSFFEMLIEMIENGIQSANQEGHKWLSYDYRLKISKSFITPSNMNDAELKAFEEIKNILKKRKWDCLI